MKPTALKDATHRLLMRSLNSVVDYDSLLKTVDRVRLRLIKLVEKVEHTAILVSRVSIAHFCSSLACPSSKPLAK